MSALVHYGKIAAVAVVAVIVAKKVLTEIKPAQTWL